VEVLWLIKMFPQMVLCWGSLVEEVLIVKDRNRLGEKKLLDHFRIKLEWKTL
jgi:hypothetical protein